MGFSWVKAAEVVVDVVEKARRSVVKTALRVRRSAIASPEVVQGVGRDCRERRLEECIGFCMGPGPSPSRRRSRFGLVVLASKS